MGLITSRRRRFIQGYVFPEPLERKVAERFDPEHVPQILEGLRCWYLACLYARKGQVLGMPSRAVDDAWHEMILMTHEYHAFCEKAFGYYLHHTPDAAMSVSMGDALAQTRRVAAEQRLPQATVAGVAMPLLFAIDAQLGLAEPEEAVSLATADRRAACSAGGPAGPADDGGSSCGGGSCGGGGGCGAGGG